MKKIITKTVGSFINITAILFPKWNANYTFHLLCKTKRVGITEKGKSFFEQGETQLITVGKHRAALHKWGHGPKTVFFLHGWLSNSQRWRKFVKELDLTEFTVYALDAPGHGMASGNHLNVEIYRESFAKAIEQIGVVDTLVCHSLGSMVASYAFLENREIPVRTYIIMGAPSGMDAIFLYFKNMLGLSKRAIQNLEAKINEVLKLPHQQISISNFLHKMTAPVLLVHDIEDRITPFSPIQKAIEGVENDPSAKNRQVVTFFIKGNDHNLKTDDVIEEVTKFIKNNSCISKNLKSVGVI